MIDYARNHPELRPGEVVVTNIRKGGEGVIGERLPSTSTDKLFRDVSPSSSCARNSSLPV